MVESENDRLRIYVIEEGEVLASATFTKADRPECFRIYRRPLLPEGAVIQRVWYEPHRRAICFMVCHSSFKPVLSRCPAPYVDGRMDFVSVTAIQDPDGRYRIEDIADILPQENPNHPNA